MTGNEFSIVFAADSRFIATARLAAASVAAEYGFDIDEIEDLRVAANELVAFLVETAEPLGSGRVGLDIRPSDDKIEIEGRVLGDDPAGVDDPVIDALTARLLDAVVDSYEFRGGWGRIIKRSSSA